MELQRLLGKYLTFHYLLTASKLYRWELSKFFKYLVTSGQILNVLNFKYLLFLNGLALVCLWEV